MKVKIVKAGFEDWYINKIDEVFEVREKFWGYQLVDEPSLFIKKQDAIVIEAENSSDKSDK